MHLCFRWHKAATANRNQCKNSVRRGRLSCNWDAAKGNATTETSLETFTTWRCTKTTMSEKNATYGRTNREDRNRRETDNDKIGLTGRDSNTTQWRETRHEVEKGNRQEWGALLHTPPLRTSIRSPNKRGVQGREQKQERIKEKQNKQRRTRNSAPMLVSTMHTRER